MSTSHPPLMLWIEGLVALGFALANACVIAVYTFVDGTGVRATVAAGSLAVSYVMVLFVLDGFPYPALVWLRRDAAGRRAILDYARGRWPLHRPDAWRP